MQHNQFTNNFPEDMPAKSRREFLGLAGRGLAGAGMFGALASCNINAQTVAHNAGKNNDTIPVALKPMEAPSEAKAPKLYSPANPEKRIGYAIVGLGNLALGQIMPGFGECKYSRPVAVVSGDAAKAAKVASQYGIPAKNIYNYTNYDDIKNNPEIDAVYIVLPNGMHEEYTVRAAKAGKHVLCEKPMATSVKEAENMIEACKNAGKKLMIAYRIQYEPGNRMVKDWVRQKTYGNIKIIESANVQNMGDPKQWRLNKKLAGGGALPDIGLYCLNTARYQLGLEPEWINASLYSTPNDARFIEVEETIMFQLRFPGGALLSAVASYGVHDSKRYRCFGDNGAWFGMDPAFPYTGLKVELAHVKDGKEWKENPSIENKNQFAREMDHMSMCILENKQPYTPGEEGLQDQKIMEAIYASAKQGKPVTMQTPSSPDAFRGTLPDAG